MNYYEHHIGDYAKATSHLSFVEDAAYSRLIRKYYDMEMPLPADLAAVQRLAGARTREEKRAVRTVLEEFFFLREDGWHNKRADSEIEAYHAKSLKARESANARWERVHTKRNADAMRSQCEGNALQSPDTSHQNKEKKEEKEKKPARMARGAPLPVDFVPNQTGAEYAKERKINVAAELQGFRNYHQAKGTVMKDWQAAWRTWCDKAVEFGRTSQPAVTREQFMTHHQATKLAAARTIFGDERNLYEQDIIDVSPRTPELLGG